MLPRKAGWPRNGGRRKWQAFGGVVLLALSLTAGCSRPPEQLFESARAESVKGQFSRARQFATAGYKKFEGQPASEWHWKFKLLLAEMLLYNGDTLEAESLLATPPPAALRPLLPSYNKLRGYVLFRQQDYAGGERLLRSAAEAAHSAGDFEVEADIQLLLGAFLKDKVRAEVASRAALELAIAHHLEYDHSAALLNLGMTFLERAHYGFNCAVTKEKRRIKRSPELLAQNGTKFEQLHRIQAHFHERLRS